MPKLDENGRLITCETVKGELTGQMRLKCPTCGGTFPVYGIGKSLPVHSPGGVGAVTLTGRLNVLAAAARQRVGVSKSAPVEFGVWEPKVNKETLPERAECFPDGGDLVATLRPASVAETEFAFGDVVHLYVYGGRGMDAQLEDVLIGWIGMESDQPTLI